MEHEYIDIPSGMGGTLPAVIANHHGEYVQVICLHPEFFPGWLMTVRRDECRPMTYQLTEAMQAIAKRRL